MKLDDMSDYMWDYEIVSLVPILNNLKQDHCQKKSESNLNLCGNYFNLKQGLLHKT